MEFFNYKKVKQLSFFGRTKGINMVKSVDFNRKQIHPFAFVGLDKISSLEIFNIINYNPVFVALVYKRSNQVAGTMGDKTTDLSGFGKSVIKLLEDFNVVIDLGRLNKKSLATTIKFISKPVIVTDAVLSTICDFSSLSLWEEELLVKKNSLLVVNIDCFNMDNLLQAVRLFIDKYGSRNLAISTFKTNKKYLLKFLTKLRATGINIEDAENIAYKNINKFLNLNLHNEFCEQKSINFY